MKNFQQNLLITLALALCGLCAWQWYYQTVQRDQMIERNGKIQQEEAAIQGYTNSINHMDVQIAQMDARITELKQTIVSNGEVIIAQKREIAKSAGTNDTLASEIIQYKSAVDMLEGKLTNAYDDIEKQNKAFDAITSNLNDAIQRYTNSVNLYNGLADKYNDVVSRLNKLQASLTNSPGK